VARITGTQGNDDLHGTQSGDVIDALAGDDRVLADEILRDDLGGADVVYAGFGDDQVVALGGANRSTARTGATR
jgi:Ca2+-binding RTX toxin-like protein